eukprot:CAMPEP_0114374868 /NCGR_PEP_ID=MMETSP0101-20121206/35919_1 /TAXON_ID=38822 ORGANISM="Pteridomonas danica, Strain PT" /NCGR_SAMPLE_ID=MMETSP0101 /ASSEMBLY_ACC=CAM_ASM_000211 /LENGTH=1368 /DNA_ID=CAMNT_0001528785 /DNA_START=233 /DNA_END=4339 /DNA_ORIENTATION=-
MSEEELRKAQQEAEVLRKMAHSNIIGCVESFVTAGKREGEMGMYCIVTEFADRGDLSVHIKTQKDNPELGYFKEREVMSIFVQLCRALRHVHHLNILHRDLKSQNVFLASCPRSHGGSTMDGMVDEPVMVKLGDFGIAKVMSNTLSLAETQIGTPYYLSPEIYEDQAYGKKSDMWSMGILLHEVASLELPFQAKNLIALSRKVLCDAPNRLPKDEITNESLYSRELQDLVDGLLDKDPEKRPSAEQVLKNYLAVSRFTETAEDDLSYTLLTQQLPKSFKKTQQNNNSNNDNDKDKNNTVTHKDNVSLNVTKDMNKEKKEHANDTQEERERSNNDILVSPVQIKFDQTKRHQDDDNNDHDDNDNYHDKRNNRVYDQERDDKDDVFVDYLQEEEENEDDVFGDSNDVTIDNRVQGGRGGGDKRTHVYHGSTNSNTNLQFQKTSYHDESYQETQRNYMDDDTEGDDIGGSGDDDNIYTKTTRQPQPNTLNSNSKIANHKKIDLWNDNDNDDEISRRRRGGGGRGEKEQATRNDDDHGKRQQYNRETEEDQQREYGYSDQNQNNRRERSKWNINQNNAVEDKRKHDSKPSSNPSKATRQYQQQYQQSPQQYQQDRRRDNNNNDDAIVKRNQHQQPSSYQSGGHAGRARDFKDQFSSTQRGSTNRVSSSNSSNNNGDGVVSKYVNSNQHHHNRASSGSGGGMVHPDSFRNKQVGGSDGKYHGSDSDTIKTYQENRNAALLFKQRHEKDLQVSNSLVSHNHNHQSRDHNNNYNSSRDHSSYHQGQGSHGQVGMSRRSSGRRDSGESSLHNDSSSYGSIGAEFYALKSGEAKEQGALMNMARRDYLANREARQHAKARAEEDLYGKQTNQRRSSNESYHSDRDHATKGDRGGGGRGASEHGQNYNHGYDDDDDHNEGSGYKDHREIVKLKGEKERELKRLHHERMLKEAADDHKKDLKMMESRLKKQQINSNDTKKKNDNLDIHHNDNDNDNRRRHIGDDSKTKNKIQHHNQNHQRASNGGSGSGGGGGGAVLIEIDWRTIEQHLPEAEKEKQLRSKLSQQDLIEKEYERGKKWNAPVLSSQRNNNNRKNPSSSSSSSSSSSDHPNPNPTSSSSSQISNMNGPKRGRRVRKKWELDAPSSPSSLSTNRNTTKTTTTDINPTTNFKTNDSHETDNKMDDFEYRNYDNRTQKNAIEQGSYESDPYENDESHNPNFNPTPTPNHRIKSVETSSPLPTRPKSSNTPITTTPVSNQPTTSNSKMKSNDVNLSVERLRPRTSEEENRHKSIDEILIQVNDVRSSFSNMKQYSRVTPQPQPQPPKLMSNYNEMNQITNSYQQTSPLSSQQPSNSDSHNDHHNDEDFALSMVKEFEMSGQSNS